MKIAIADEASLKFLKDLKEHWESLGHEVRYEHGASEHLAQWADLYYIEWSTNNLRYLWKFYTGQMPKENYPEGWDNNKKPVFACRAIDWDVWIGWARDQVLIDFVDKWICIASHIEEKLRREANYEGKLKFIKPGVNTNKFTLKTKPTDGFQLGMVLGDLWWYKNHMGGLDIFKTLYDQDNRWRLHIRGQHEPGEYNPVMFEHYLESRGIKDAVTLYGPQEDMSAWYENIDILLHPGMKETFCYAVAEAMSKGIPVVVNEFYGSKNVWPEPILYQTHQEAIHMINNPWPGKGVGIVNHDYIKASYGLDRYFKETDEYLGIS